jgi:hypothetical protein
VSGLALRDQIKNKKQIDEQWKNLLTPDILRTRLISCSIYQTAFHFLKSSIIDRIKGFFTDGFKDGKLVVGPQYSSNILARNRSPVFASLDWLKASGAVNDGDIALYGRLAQHRNDISHALHANLLNESLMEELPALFDELRGLLRKIEVWWIVEVDMTISSEGVPDDVDESDVHPGPVMMLDLMIGVALGSEETAGSYLKEYLKAVGH